MDIEQKKEIVSLLMGKGILIDSNTLTEINTIQNPVSFKTFLQEKSEIFDSSSKFSEILAKYSQTSSIISNNGEIQNTEELEEDVERPNVKVVFSYEGEPKKEQCRISRRYLQQDIML